MLLRLIRALRDRRRRRAARHRAAIAAHHQGPRWVVPAQRRPVDTGRYARIERRHGR